MVMFVPRLAECCTGAKEEAAETLLFAPGGIDGAVCTEAFPVVCQKGCPFALEAVGPLQAPMALPRSPASSAARAARTPGGTPGGMSSGSGSGPLDTFFARIERSSPKEPLGMHLDLADGAPVHVCDLLNGLGPVRKYNARALEEARIRPGDYLVGVDGARGSPPTLLALLRESRSPTLEVARPVRWSARISRQQVETMGLELNYATEGRSLVIDKVLDGAVGAWSASNPKRAIRRQDRIVSVNGAGGSPTELLDMIGASRQEVMLGLSRACLTSVVPPRLLPR